MEDILLTVQEWLGEDNKLGIDIWERKYRYNNETFDEWLDRVSGGNEDLKNLIKEKKFMFGGRILSNRGLDKKGKKISLSNCYVMSPPDDSIESIFDCAKKLARTYSYGGGCGVDISNLAPRGAKVNNAAKETSGSVSFMDLYSLVTELIGQNGRRGALMLSISCEHPDLEEFIELKSDLDKCTKANISVRITDKFMDAVKNRKLFNLTFTREETGETIEKEIDAYKMFHKLCEMNWNYAEPGMLFWDRIENWNLLSSDSSFKYSGVNPCAEETLPAGGSCLLGSINLSEFVTVDNKFNFKSFENTVCTAVKALNDVLDEGIPLHPLKEQRDSVRDWRQIGLGIFGLADMLIKMGIRYGSRESVELCNMIGQKMACQAIKTSSSLASEYGAYPNYNKKAVSESSYFYTHTTQPNRSQILQDGLRNSQLLTIAPTGCQKGNTLVATNKGIIKLSELVDIHGEKWQEINNLIAEQEYGENKILKGYVNGYAPTKKIRLSNNLELESTYNHKYRIIRDNKYIWCRADEISIGDIIPSKIGYYENSLEYKLNPIKQENYHNIGTFVKLPDEMNTKLAFILGAYYANGSNHYRGRDKKFSSIRFSMNTKKNSDMSKLCNYIFDVFGIKVTLSFSSDGNCTEICLNNRNVCRWIEANLLKKNKSTNSTIPLAVRCSSKDSIKSFLDGYYMCDGSKSGNNLYIDTTNYNIAQEILVLYRAIGIDARIYIDEKRIGAKSNSPMYRIYFGGYKSLDYSSEKMRYISNENKDTLQSVKNILGDHFIYDKVISIVDSFNFTLDIEVENKHCYVANGTISHNTISSMLGVSGGIEPIYANYYERKTESLHGHDEYYKVYTPIVKEYMKIHGLKDDSELPEYFVTTQKLDYKERIDMQAIWQKHIDASISSTVNVQNSFSVEDVEKLYLYAWEKGLKGVTIFRDGCARTGILSTDSKIQNETKESYTVNDLPRGTVIKADDNCIGRKRTLQTGCGTLHCEAFFDPDDGSLLETYFSKGSSGGCNQFMIGLSRMISLSARGGIDIYSIVDQLKSSGTCPSYAVRNATKHDTSKGSSCPVAIGNALVDMYEEVINDIYSDEDVMEEDMKDKEINDIKHAKCPQCGGKLVFEGGCNTCKDCGWSKCD